MNISISIEIEDDGDTHSFDRVSDAKDWVDNALEEAKDRVSSLEDAESALDS